MLIIAALFFCAVIGVTSKNKWVAIISAGALVAVPAYVATGVVTFISCEQKYLPFSFCGEIRGIINIVLTQTLVSVFLGCLSSFLFSIRRARLNREKK